MRTLLLLSAALAWHVATAQPADLGALDVVTNPHASFVVSARVDRDPTGNVIPGYRVGESVTITLGADRDTYVYLFNVRADGTVALFFPNPHDTDHRLQANEPRVVPGAGYTLDLEGPTGLDKVIAIASLEQLDLASLLRTTDRMPFAHADLNERAFAHALTGILEPLDETAWAADTIAFYVGDAAEPSTPPFGLVRIESRPTAATVIVDGVVQGITPLALYGPPGTYTLRLELDAYEPYDTTLDLEPDGRLTLEAALLQKPTLARLELHVNVAGATIHLNGHPYPAGDSTSVTFADLLAGEYEVTVTAPDHHTGIEHVAIQGGSIRELVLELSPIAVDGQPAARQGR